MQSLDNNHWAFLISQNIYMKKYILCGELTVRGNATINGTIFDIRSLSGLIEILKEGGYNNIMELTNNSRSVNNLEIDDLIIINFECLEKSSLNILGTSSSLGMKIIE